MTFHEEKKKETMKMQATNQLTKKQQNWILILYSNQVSVLKKKRKILRFFNNKVVDLMRLLV